MPSELQQIRPIEPTDNPGITNVIRTVMPEFGASGPGFAIHDPEVNDMSGAYSLPGSAYFVAVHGNTVVGGAGIAPLLGGEPDTCELRKMYILAEVRRRGLGQRLLDLCLVTAENFGYLHCYLETLKNMDSARVLYAKNGFTPLDKPLGNTGHFGCDAWLVRALHKW